MPVSYDRDDARGVMTVTVLWAVTGAKGNRAMITKPTE
jgi:hypothetical protein